MFLVFVSYFFCDGNSIAIFINPDKCDGSGAYKLLNMRSKIESSCFKIDGQG
jgi:hypothetical protein